MAETVDKTGGAAALPGATGGRIEDGQVMSTPSGAAWQVIRSALRDTWSDLFNTAVINLLWLILTLLVVTAPPATMALFYTGNRIAHDEPTDPGDFLAAFRRYFGLGWRWGALQGLMLLLLVGDIYLSGRLSRTPGGHLAQGLYLTGLAFWLLLQVFALAFLFEQQRPSIRLALRNGVVMLGNNLAFSAILGVLILLMLLAGVLFFCVTSAAGGVFLALVGSHAVLNRLGTRSPDAASV